MFYTIDEYIIKEEININELYRRLSSRKNQNHKYYSAKGWMIEEDKMGRVKMVNPKVYEALKERGVA